LWHTARVQCMHAVCRTLYCRGGIVWAREPGIGSSGYSGGTHATCGSWAAVVNMVLTLVCDVQWRTCCRGALPCHHSKPRGRGWTCTLHLPSLLRGDCTTSACEKWPADNISQHVRPSAVYSECCGACAATGASKAVHHVDITGAQGQHLGRVRLMLSFKLPIDQV
jgi:hypothetical protein